MSELVRWHFVLLHRYIDWVVFLGSYCQGVPTVGKKMASRYAQNWSRCSYWCVIGYCIVYEIQWKPNTVFFKQVPQNLMVPPVVSKFPPNRNEKRELKRHLRPLDAFSGLLNDASKMHSLSGLCPEPHWGSLQRSSWPPSCWEEGSPPLPMNPLPAVAPQSRILALCASRMPQHKFLAMPMGSMQS